MNYLSAFSTSLSEKALSSHFVSDEIDYDVTVEMMFKQKTFFKGCIYIGTAPKAYTQLEKAKLENSATIIICGTKSAELSKIIPCENINYIESSLPLEEVFNELQAYIKKFDAEKNGPIYTKLTGIWSHYLNLENPPAETARDIIESITGPLNPEQDRVRILLADYNEKLISCDEFRQKLARVFPSSTIFKYKTHMLLLNIESSDMTATNSKSAAASSLDYDEKLLCKILAEADGHIVISNRTQKYEKLSIMYKLDARLLEYAPLLPYIIDDRIFPYDNYSDYVAIDLASRKFKDVYNSNDIILIVNPIVVVLTRFDKLYHNNLRDVLYYYLVFNGNLERTANRLFMHKNTVANKLKKIKELVNIDLDDGILRNQLVFSCRAIIFYEKVLNEHLQL